MQLLRNGTEPDNPVSYGDLAVLLADQLGDRPGAEALLRQTLRG